MSPIPIHPDSDKRPLLPEGQYGLGGEAELVGIAARKVPLSKDASEEDKAAAGFFADFTVQVDHPSEGRVFVHSQPYGAANTQLGQGKGSMVKAFLAGLGLDAAAVMFSDQPDEKGENYPILGPDPKCKVVIEVGVDKGRGANATPRNYLKSIARLS